jgi:hypothetical protein
VVAHDVGEFVGERLGCLTVREVGPDSDQPLAEVRAAVRVTEVGSFDSESELADLLGHPVPEPGGCVAGQFD